MAGYLPTYELGVGVGEVYPSYEQIFRIFQDAPLALTHIPCFRIFTSQQKQKQKTRGGGYRQFIKEGGGYFIENDYICDMEDIVLLKPASVRPIAFGDGFLDYRLSDVLRESGEDLSFVCIAKTGVMVVYSATGYSHVKHFIGPLVGYIRADELRGDDAIIRYRVGDSKPVWVKLFVETLGVDLSVSQDDK